MNSYQIMNAKPHLSKYQMLIWNANIECLASTKYHFIREHNSNLDYNPKIIVNRYFFFFEGYMKIAFGKYFVSMNPKFETTNYSSIVGFSLRKYCIETMIVYSILVRVFWFHCLLHFSCISRIVLKHSKLIMIEQMICRKP